MRPGVLAWKAREGTGRVPTARLSDFKYRSVSEQRRMTRLEGSVEVKAPLEDAFSYIAEGLNTPSWHPSIKKTRRTSEGPLRVGSRLEVEAVLGGRRFVWEQRVVEFAANDHFRDASVSGPFKKFEDWATFERTPTGTRWTFAVEYQLKGGAFGRLLDLVVFRRRAAKHHTHAMKMAKQILEGRGPLESDGHSRGTRPEPN